MGKGIDRSVLPRILEITALSLIIKFLNALNLFGTLFRETTISFIPLGRLGFFITFLGFIIGSIFTSGSRSLNSFRKAG